MTQRLRSNINVLILPIILVLLAAPLWAQQSKEPNWDAFRFLLGEWIGEGSGKPGEATGGFSFAFDLQERVLVRKSRADYPATKDKPAYSHTDLMVIYQEAGRTTRAIYFDNEGHVIHYALSFSKDQNTLSFISEASSNEPRFRFTYSKSGDDKLTFQFDIAPPGKPEAFSRYIEGSAHRK